jgi:hypothetical protein
VLNPIVNPPIEKPMRRNDHGETLPMYSGEKKRIGTPNLDPN